MLNKILKIILISVLALITLVILMIISLFFIRLFGHREIDDVTPAIPCNEELLKKVDVLWVIPDFKNYNISKNQTWCNKIKNLNKKIGLHGYQHTYNEFGGELKEQELVKAINIFKNCFGYKPTMFKPPQLNISKQNKELLKKYNLKLKYRLNQETHKVYHCNDTGILSNKFVNIF